MLGEYVSGTEHVFNHFGVILGKMSAFRVAVLLRSTVSLDMALTATRIAIDGGGFMQSGA